MPPCPGWFDNTTVGSAQTSWPSRLSANSAAELPTWPATTRDWTLRIAKSALPLVAELAQLQEHGLGVGLLRQVGKRFTQPLDHRRALQAEEGVDLLLQRQGGDQRLSR